MRKEVFDWLNQAESDLKTAEILLKNEVYYACAFYCQQVAEKSLKAVVIAKLKISVQTHNLLELARQVKAESEILNACRKLTPHYLQSRYPGFANALPADLYDKPLALDLLKNARMVFEWCEKNSMK